MVTLSRILLRCTLLLTGLLAWPTAAMAADTTAPAALVLPSQMDERIALGTWLDLLDAGNSVLSPSELAATDMAGQLDWQRLRHETLSLGLREQPLWLRLRIDNPGPAGEQLLELSRATLGHVGLYSQDELGRWQWQERGVEAVSRNGGIPLPGVGFRLHMPHGESRHYLLLASDHAIQTPVLLGDLTSTLYAEQNSAGWFGWSLGLLSGLVLVLAIQPPANARLATRWSLIGLEAAVILYALADRGVLGNWWLNVPGAQHGVLQLSSVLLQISLCWHVHCQLQQRESLSLRQARWLIGWLGLLATMLMLGLVIKQSAGIRLLAGLPALTAGLLSALAGMTWLRQRQRAELVLLLVMASLLLLHLVLLCGMSSLLALPWEPYQLLLAWHLASAPVLLWLISLPARPEPRTQVRPLATTTDGRPLRILVVEDNLWVSEVISGLLRKLGITVAEVGDGHQALEWLARERCDLVLMDCDLPGLDGVSATQVWRRREQLEGRHPLPIIAVTAHVSAAQRQQALDAGMNDFLAKPVDMRKLRDTVVRWLGDDALQGSARMPRENT